MDHARCSCKPRYEAVRGPYKDVDVNCAFHGAAPTDPKVRWNLSDNDRRLLRAMRIALED